MSQPIGFYTKDKKRRPITAKKPSPFTSQNVQVAQSISERYERLEEPRNRDYKIVMFKMRLKMLDEVSENLDTAIDASEKPLREAQMQATKQLFTSDAPDIVKMREEVYGTKDPTAMSDFDIDEQNSYWHEGSSGLRNFIAQGVRNQLGSTISSIGFGDVEDKKSFAGEMRKTWFLKGKFDELPQNLKEPVTIMATRTSEPMTIYRDEDKFCSCKVGDKVDFKVPRSFSSNFRTLSFGSRTTYVVDGARHGTHVSALSQFPGEAEIISYSPKGYIVTKIETTMWRNDPHQKRQLVHLREAS